MVHLFIYSHTAAAEMEMVVIRNSQASIIDVLFSISLKSSYLSEASISMPTIFQALQNGSLNIGNIP